MKHLPCRVTRTIQSALSIAAILACGLAVQAQPTISSISPDGSHLFQFTNTFSFTAGSSVGVANVSVGLTVTSLRGTSYLKNLTTNTGLTITGSVTNWSVSTALTSNKLYAASIQVTDAKGASTTTNVSFDTITPSYTFEAEDWDYTRTNSDQTTTTGLFFDNPQTNAYAGLPSTPGTDVSPANSGGSSYRPWGLATEGNGDKPRVQWAGKTDYDVGWTSGGQWANYTRTFPAGAYNVYMRGACGGSQATKSATMSVNGGHASLISNDGTTPQFSVPNIGGWQSYSFAALKDQTGDLVIFTNDGTAGTLQVQTVGGSYNANFYMLVPADTNVQTATVTFSGFYPDGAVQFEPTNTLTFGVSSATGVDASTFLVQLTGTNLVGQTINKTYTTVNGLTVSGPSTGLTVSLPLSSNVTYSAFIQVLDLQGNPNSASLTFDTITPFYTFEAEDYDYNGGQFFDNPAPDSYQGLDGTLGVDYYVDDPQSGSRSYRNQGTAGGPETEGASDVPRVEFVGHSDYDVGFNDPANWENYTRTFPTGTFNIFLRGANGGGGPGGVSMGQVTKGAGTTSQTVTNLGSFAIPSTASWQKYLFAPLKDKSGNLVKLTFPGNKPVTLRASGPASLNTQFYLLEPANTTLPRIDGLYPDGTTLFQQTNALSFAATSSEGIGTNNIVVTLNGTVVSGLVFTGSSTNWHVSYPGLQPNTVYSASVSVTTLGSNSYNQSFTFDTYSPNNYQWEAADYDYTSNGVSALSFDNPQIDLYNGLGATPGIDEQEVTAGTPISENVYRTNLDGSLLIPTQGGGDAARPQFGTNLTWRINWFGFGDFANYTRRYPAGTYRVIGRFTEGGAASSARLLKVTAGVGTANQTTSVLGNFFIPLGGWNAWTYEPLVDSGNNPVTITLDGSKTTLQLAGPATDDGQTINAGFFMLVPAQTSAPSITASVSGGQVNVSFPSKTGTAYQVQYKNNLSDATWLSLGAAVTGNGSVQSVQDTNSIPASPGHRFYRIELH